MRGKIKGPVVEAAEHGLKCLSTIFRSVFVTCPQSNVHHRTLSGLLLFCASPQCRSSLQERSTTLTNRRVQLWSALS